MIAFRTIIPIQKELSINHRDPMMMFGSCFTEYMGRRLNDLLFPISCNPLGILFNPISILQTIQRIVSNKKVTQKDLFQQEGVWNSFDFHSQFAQLSAEDYIANINRQIEEAHQFAKSARYIFFTLGTSWVYEKNTDHKVVANCHKMPSNLFSRRRISCDECVEALSLMIQQIRSINKEAKVVFTVSPIRHWKDGAHGNQLSKATLLLAIDKLCETERNCHYFPSYELLMDELRDYRFYADDMLHPNDLAQAYIWEKFQECYFNEETNQLNKRIEQVNQAIHHRPFNPKSEGFAKFKAQTLQNIEKLREDYPFLSFEEETIEQFSKL